MAAAAGGAVAAVGAAVGSPVKQSNATLLLMGSSTSKRDAVFGALRDKTLERLDTFQYGPPTLGVEFTFWSWRTPEGTDLRMECWNTPDFNVLSHEPNIQLHLRRLLPQQHNVALLLYDPKVERDPALLARWVQFIRSLECSIVIHIASVWATGPVADDLHNSVMTSIRGTIDDVSDIVFLRLTYDATEVRKQLRRICEDAMTTPILRLMANKSWTQLKETIKLGLTTKSYHALFDVSPNSLVASAVLRDWYLVKGKQLFDAGTPADIGSRFTIQNCETLPCMPALLWLYSNVSVLRIVKTNMKTVDWKAIPSSVQHLMLQAPCVIPVDTLKSNSSISALTLDAVFLTADQLPPNTNNLHLQNYDLRHCQLLLQGMATGTKRHQLLAGVLCLDFYQCALDCSALRSVLSHTRTLTTLLLNSCNLSDASLIDTILPAMTAISTLQKISVAGTAPYSMPPRPINAHVATDNHLSAAADALIQQATCWPHLQMLDLRQNSVTPIVGAQLVRLCVAWKRPSLLEGLALSPVMLMYGGLPAMYKPKDGNYSFPGDLPTLHHMPLVVQVDPQLRAAFIRAAAAAKPNSTDLAQLASVSKVTVQGCPCLTMTDMEQWATWFPTCNHLELARSNINDAMLQLLVTRMLKLRTIDVSGCTGVTRVPQDISRLKQLSVLKLEGTAVPLPSQIISNDDFVAAFAGLPAARGTAHARLAGLQQITFDPCGVEDDMLRRVGERCTGCLQLCLAHCSLSPTALDTVVSTFPKLRILDVTDCRLTALPTTLGSLADLEAIKCTGNALPDIPAEIIGDSKLVAAYFRASLGEARLPISYVKLVLAGLGCEGKTTLLRALQGHPRLVHLSDRTRGIDVQTWTPELHPAWATHCQRLQSAATDACDVRIPALTFIVHDLAGQPVYYGTHQRFIVQSESTAFIRALFLVVVSLADWGMDRPQRIRLWLDYVHNSCPGAIIVIVGTHLDCVGQPAVDLSWNGPPMDPTAQIDECKRRMAELVTIYNEWSAQVAAQISSMMALIKTHGEGDSSTATTLRKLQACRDRPCEAVAAVAISAKSGTCLIAELKPSAALTWSLQHDTNGIAGLQNLMIRTVVTKVDHMQQLVPASWQLLLSAAVPNAAGVTGLKAAFPDGREIIRVPQLHELPQWSRTFADVQRLEAAVAFGSRMGLLNVVSVNLADHLILHPQWLLDRMSAVQCQIRYWLESFVQLPDLHQLADETCKFLFQSEVRRIGSTQVEFGQVAVRSWADIVALVQQLFGETLSIDVQWKMRLFSMQDQPATLAAMLAQVEQILSRILAESKQGIDNPAVREFLQLVGYNMRPYWQTGVAYRRDQLTVLESQLAANTKEYRALSTSGTLSWAGLQLIWGTATSEEQLIAWEACHAAGTVCCMPGADPTQVDTFIPGMLAWTSLQQEHRLPFCGWRPRPAAKIQGKVMCRRLPVKSLPCFLMPQLVRFLYLQGFALQLRCANAVHVSVHDGEQLLVLIRRDAGSEGGNLVRQVDWSDAGDVCVDFIGWTINGSGGTWRLFRLVLAHVRALLNQYWPGFIVAGVVPVVHSDDRITLEPVSNHPELCPDVDDTIDDRFWILDDQDRDPELSALTCILLRDSGEALIRYCTAEEAALYQQLHNDEVLVPPVAYGQSGSRNYVVWPTVQTTGLARISADVTFDDAVVCTFQAARCLLWLRRQGYAVYGSLLRHMVKLQEGWRMMLPASTLRRAADYPESVAYQQLIRFMLSWVLQEEAIGGLLELVERAKGSSSMLQLVHIAHKCIASKTPTLRFLISSLPVKFATGGSKLRLTPAVLQDLMEDEDPSPGAAAAAPKPAPKPGAKQKKKQKKKPVTAPSPVVVVPTPNPVVPSPGTDGGLSPFPVDAGQPSPDPVVAPAPVVVFEQFVIASDVPVAVLGGGLFLEASHSVSRETVLVQLLGDPSVVDSIRNVQRWSDATKFFVTPLAGGKLESPLLGSNWAVVWPHFEAAYDSDMVYFLDFQAVVQRASFAAAFVQFLHRNAHVIRRPLHSTLVLCDGRLRVHPVEAISALETQVDDISDNSAIYGLYRHDMWQSGVFALRMVRRRLVDAAQPDEIAKELHVVANSAFYEPQYPLVRWFILPCLDISSDDSVSTNLSLRYDKATAALQALRDGHALPTEGGSHQLAEEVANLISSFQLLSGATGTLTEQFVDMARVTQQLQQCMVNWMERPLAADTTPATGTVPTPGSDADSDAMKAYCTHFEMCWRTTITYANMVLAGGDVRSDANWKMMVGKAIKFVGQQVQLFPGADAVSSMLSAGFTWAGRRQERQACEKLIAADTTAAGLGPAVARLLASRVEHLLQAEVEAEDAAARKLSWKEKVLAFGRRVLAEPPKSRIQKLAVAHCSAILALIREGSGNASAEALVDAFLAQFDASSADESKQVKCKRMINVLLDGAATRLWSSSQIVISALTGAINGEDIDLMTVADAGKSIADDLLAIARPSPPVEEEVDGDEDGEAADDSKSATDEQAANDDDATDAGTVTDALPAGVETALDHLADAAEVAVEIFGRADGEEAGTSVIAGQLEGAEECKHVSEDGVVETKADPAHWVGNADCLRPHLGAFHRWRPRQLLLEHRNGVLVLEISKLKSDEQKEEPKLLRLQRVVQTAGGKRFQVQAFDADSSISISWHREQDMDQFLAVLRSLGVAVQQSAKQ